MARNKTKKIIFFLDSRATFSYSKNVIVHLKKFKRLKYNSVVSGAYLDKKFGDAYKNITLEKIKVIKKIKFKSSSNQRSSWAYNLGDAIKNYSKELSKLKPDLVVITGDRIETLAFCITSAYMNIPIAHIQAGDKSGHIDDLARAAIAKFSNIHFASCQDSVTRLLKNGEEKKRIFNVGAPQLDDIKLFLNRKRVYSKFKTKKKNFLILFHPVLNEIGNIKYQLENIFSSTLNFDCNVNCIYPNNDLGYIKILEVINKYKKIRNFNVYKNLTRKNFLNMALNSDIIIGNSSFGIIESSLFCKPVVNVGNRQNGRPQSGNIVNSTYLKRDITNKINYALYNKKFLKKLKKTRNIFYKKNSGFLICRIINKVVFNKKIMNKY